jgi:hypothetical protein
MKKVLKNTLIKSTKNRLFCLFVLLSISYANAQTKLLPETQVAFKKIQLLDKYITEGASIGDIDNDGYMDIVAGSLWWKGPDFKEANAYAPVHYFPITGPGLKGFSDNFYTFPGNYDTDEWTDILRIGLPGTGSEWVKNPAKNNISSEDSVPQPLYYNALPNVCHELPSYINIIGDEKRELLAFSQGYLALGVPSMKENEAWDMLPISQKDPEKFTRYAHGLGAGDINMDGLIDILEKSGWWEQPKNWDRTTPWKYHAYSFSPGKGGAQMFAYDVNGDGLNDVVTAMNAHGYGLSWFEQVTKEDHIWFKEHQVMTNKAEDNTYGVCFAQLHGMACADIDNDGIPDIVTGKCYYAHSGKDLSAEDPAVIYWFKTVRHSDGSAELIPYKIDDDSGTGRQISTGDLNSDGKMDVVVGNKKGVFVFIQTDKN